MVKGKQGNIFTGSTDICSELDGSTALSEPSSILGRTAGSTDILDRVQQTKFQTYVYFAVCFSWHLATTGVFSDRG
tara:strand:- start:1985 stop:2212 length:228 start_codon:yes stop_codon:yes gene_type:complete